MKLLALLTLVSLCKSPMANITLEKNTEDSFNTLIQEILKNSLVEQCVVIICDPVYYAILDLNLFAKLDFYLTYFLIVVEESEDLLAPYETTQLALETARAHGCGYYIILIANGLQSSRLLKFGERYRILNTRGKFVMIYDYRLFQTNLHYLWQRIINVIFIREYGGSRKIITKAKTSGWFDISTVQFPYPIKKIMVPRRLSIWKQKFHTDVELFKDKTSDLKNQTLKVVVFAHTPATVKMEVPKQKIFRAVLSTASTGFAGIEIEILHTLSTAMNFVPELYEPQNADIELWGKKHANGQYTGIIGEMVKNHADFALGDLHYTAYFLRVMDLSIPYNTECLTFLTPEALTNNSWKTLILPFTPELWMAILLSLALIGAIFHVLSKFHDKINAILFKDIKARRFALRQELGGIKTIRLGQNLNPNTKYSLMKQKYLMPKIEGEPVGLYLFKSLGNSVLYTYGMLLVITLPKLPTGWSIRMLTGWYWLYCTLIVVAYKASMTAILANPAPRVTIDTVQELLDSNLECGGWGETNMQFFQTSLDVASQAIGTKFQRINDSDDAIDRIVEGTFALYENTYFLKQALVKKQLGYGGQTGSNSKTQAIPKADHYLHIMNECLINMPTSIGLQKNSPIKLRVDTYVRRVFEAGLINKWLADVMQQSVHDEIRSLIKGSESTKAVMNMEKFFGALVALFIGYSIGLVILVWEIVNFEFIIKKHPNFNKYTKQIMMSK